MDGQMDIEMDETAGCSKNGLPQHVYKQKLLVSNL